MKMYAFIINPVAGNGRSLKVWANLKKHLDKKKIIYRSFFTKYAGHAQEITQQISSLHEDQLVAIIAVGGDGTASEVVNGLTNHPDLPVGFIPVGTANAIAHGLSIPKKPVRALEQLLNKKKKQTKIDIGNYHPSGLRKPKLFLSQLNLGFTAEVSKHLQTAKYTPVLRKLACGKLAFLLSFLHILFSYSPRNIHLTIDGEAQNLENVWLVGIANLHHNNLGLRISLGAKPTDGQLHLYLIHDVSPWKLFLHYIVASCGFHIPLKKGITFYTGKSIVLDVDSTTKEGHLEVQVDGELIGQTPIAVTLHSQSRLLL